MVCDEPTMKISHPLCNVLSRFFLREIAIAGAIVASVFRCSNKKIAYNEMCNSYITNETTRTNVSPLS